MSDITDISPANRFFKLLHPVTDEPVGITFELRHGTHPLVKAAEHAWQDARLKKSKGLTAAALENLKLDRIKSAIAGWEFVPPTTYKGTVPEFSEGKLNEFLRDPKLAWVTPALDAALNEDSEFFRTTD